MNTDKAEAITRKHMQRVSELLGLAASVLIQRGSNHDLSKLKQVELEPLQRMQDVIDREGQVPYGTPEYKKRTDMLGEMWKHHVANNSHHPEHYVNGVNGMCLFDVMEMFFDWKAASERGEEEHMSITKACERYKIDDQLKSILINTAKRMNYKYE